MTGSGLPLGGKTAIVTGSSRNIGRAIALALAADGAAVVVNARADEEGADAVVAEIEAAGGKAIKHMADVTIEADVDGWIHQEAESGLEAPIGTRIGVISETEDEHRSIAGGT